MLAELIYSGHRFQCFTTAQAGSFLHMHKEVELLYLIKGEMKITMNTKEYLAQEGDFVLIFPYTIHKAEGIGDIEYLLCTFDVDILPYFTNVFHHSYIEDSPVQKVGQVPKEAVACVSEIIRRKELQQASNITFGYLTIIVEHLLQGCSLKESNHTKQEDWIFRVIAYVNENFRSSIRLDAMAEELGLNKYFVSRNFKQHVGCSLERYINILRLDYARNLLLFTNDSITDIAFDSGFTNVSTFYRVFSQEGYGTPQQLRKSQRKI